MPRRRKVSRCGKSPLGGCENVFRGVNSPGADAKNHRVVTTSVERDRGARLRAKSSKANVSIIDRDAIPRIKLVVARGSLRWRRLCCRARNHPFDAKLADKESIGHRRNHQGEQQIPFRRSLPGNSDNMQKRAAVRDRIQARDYFPAVEGDIGARLWALIRTLESQFAFVQMEADGRVQIGALRGAIF